jgi:hypothetical protein
MSNTTRGTMPVAEVPNDQVACMAREYRYSVDYLYARIGEVHCISPLLMMGAFGIELFLKSLNSECVYQQDETFGELGGYRVTAKPSKWGHKLVDQFDYLNPILQAELEAAYKMQPVVRGKSTIREALEAYNDLFSGARYSFECQGNDRGQSITGLVKLLDVIADHVDSLEKRVSFN